MLKCLTFDFNNSNPKFFGIMKLNIIFENFTLNNYNIFCTTIRKFKLFKVKFSLKKSH